MPRVAVGCQSELARPVDYDHGYHAGNRADVWKHVVLLSVLASLKQVPVAYAETHAGRGRYRPAPGGEWTTGVGALLPAGEIGSGPVDRYLARVRRHEPLLPGSPLLAGGSLGRRDTLLLHEADPGAATDLSTALAGDARARVVPGDGWSLAIGPPAGDRVNVVLIDPPYSGPDDWSAAADALIRWHAADPRAVLMLWLPVKRWTRPNALRARVRSAGVPATHLDLTWARPVGDALAGSGTTLVNAPPGAIAEALAAGVHLGPRLSADGTWSARAEQ
jgi:23S rRNA (adenine2030-N6)-methyltransferase